MGHAETMGSGDARASSEIAAPRAKRRRPARTRRSRVPSGHGLDLLFDAFRAWVAAGGAMLALVVITAALRWIESLVLGAVLGGESPELASVAFFVVLVLDTAIMALPFLGAYAVAAARAGRRPTVGGCLAQWRRLPALAALLLAWTAFSVLLVGGLAGGVAMFPDGTPALIAPLVIVVAFIGWGTASVALPLGAAVCVIDGVGPRTALSRVRELARGRWLPIAFALLGVFAFQFFLLRPALLPAAVTLDAILAVVRDDGGTFSVHGPAWLLPVIKALGMTLLAAFGAATHLTLSARAERTDVATVAARKLGDS